MNDDGGPAPWSCATCDRDTSTYQEFSDCLDAGHELLVTDPEGGFQVAQRGPDSPTWRETDE